MKSAVACALLLALTACYPLPIRSPTRTTDSAPTPNKIDLTFLKTGSTTREEVQTKLDSISTRAGDNRFFWGRPRVSKYRLVLMVGYIPLPVYPGDEGQVEKPPRTWGTENLLVGYDDRGLVKSWTLAGDNRLLEELDRFSNAASPPLDLPSPLTVNAVSYSVHEKHKQAYRAAEPLTLTTDSLECFDVKVARSRLRKIVGEKGSDSYDVRLRMSFERPIDFSKTLLGKRTDHLDLTVDPPTLLLLRRYMTQTPRSTARPEGRSATN